MKSIESKLINEGCQCVESYCLSNNHGYLFNKNGVRYDLRHWVNCYGVTVDYWELSKVNKDFDTLEKVIEYIKTI